MTFFDERFLMHRLRSTSIAGVIACVLATSLWFYQYVFQHQWRWDLFAVPVTMGVIKQSLMLWYRYKD